MQRRLSKARASFTKKASFSKKSSKNVKDVNTRAAPEPEPTTAAAEDDLAFAKDFTKGIVDDALAQVAGEVAAEAVAVPPVPEAAAAPPTSAPTDVDLVQWQTSKQSPEQWSKLSGLLLGLALLAAATAAILTLAPELVFAAEPPPPPPPRQKVLGIF